MTADEGAVPVDPVLVRRARWARLGAAGTRLGYTLVLVAIVAFVVGVVTGFGPVVRATVTVALLATTLTLAPGIVIGYAVRAAEREDRERRR
ncbi:MAG: hypothetical protein M3Q48_04415 [Actinomycetota bacterium]|nr:hypothetical protein [Actinomycetota bacterium]